MDAYLGEIKIWPSPRCPTGWMYCNGSVLTISGNEALYAIIGVTYGGDGVKNFALPDLRNKIPIHMGAGPNTNGTLPPVNHPIGQNGGQAAVTLTTAQMPVHEHVAFGSTLNADTKTPASNTLLGVTPTGTNPYMIETSPGKDFDFNALSLSAAGGGNSHNNVMPSRTVNYIICVTAGVFPAKP